MVEAVGENGYARTPVAEVIARAAVSRRAFYEHFPNKEVCFTAAVDAIARTAATYVEATVGEATGHSRDVEATIEALFSRAVAHPAAVRLVLAELGALGSDGIAKREQVLAVGEALLHEIIGLADSGDAPNPIMRATTGGVSQVLYARACHNLAIPPTLIPDLLDWMSAYHPLPANELDVRGGATRLRISPGGRAPGSLSPTHEPGRHVGLRGAGAASHSLVVHSQRERILDAVAILGAADGFMAMTISRIIVHAGVSADTFYAHFASKEDAFLVAYEVGHARSLAATDAACRGAPDWPTSVRAGIAALFEFLASEPAFAHLALIDAQVVTPHTAARVRNALASYEQMFTRGLENSAHHASALAGEAIVGGLFELCVTYTLQARAHELGSLVAPATYFALAPIIGAEAAAGVALAPA